MYVAKSALLRMCILCFVSLLEDHPLSAVLDCLFNIFAANLHICGRSTNCNLRPRHAVPTRTDLSRHRLSIHTARTHKITRLDYDDNDNNNNNILLRRRISNSINKQNNKQVNIILQLTSVIRQHKSNSPEEAGCEKDEPCLI